MKYQHIIINLYTNNYVPVEMCKIYIINSKERYCGKTDSSGICELFVPYGRYNFVIIDKRFYSIIRKVNICENITFNRIKLKTKNMIYGKIVDKNKKPIEKAAVILFKKDKNKDNPIDYTFTDLKGEYYFTGMQKGDYYVLVQKDK